MYIEIAIAARRFGVLAASLLLQSSVCAAQTGPNPSSVSLGAVRGVSVTRGGAMEIHPASYYSPKETRMLRPDSRADIASDLSNPTVIEAGDCDFRAAEFPWQTKYDEWIYVLEGDVSIKEKDREIRARPGDVFLLREGALITYASHSAGKFFYGLYPAEWRAAQEKPKSYPKSYAGSRVTFVPAIRYQRSRQSPAPERFAVSQSVPAGARRLGMRVLDIRQTGLARHASGDSVYYVVTGAAYVEEDGTRTELQPRDIVHVRANTRYTVGSDAQARLLELSHPVDAVH